MLRFALLEGRETLQEREGVPPYQSLLWGSLRGRSCPLPTACSRLLPPSGANSAPGACGRGLDAAGSQPPTRPPTHRPSSNLPGENKLQSLVRKIMKTSNENRKNQTDQNTSLVAQASSRSGFPRAERARGNHRWGGAERSRPTTGTKSWVWGPLLGGHGTIAATRRSGSAWLWVRTCPSAR